MRFAQEQCNFSLYNQVALSFVSSIKKPHVTLSLVIIFDATLNTMYKRKKHQCWSSVKVKTFLQEMLLRKQEKRNSLGEIIGKTHIIKDIKNDKELLKHKVS